MKRSLKRMMLLIAVLLTVIMPLHGVHAESVVKDGVSVTLSTDKDSYAPGETVKVNLLLKNDSGADLQNVTMENLTPAGCVPLPGATTTKTLPALANNGSVTHSTSFQVEKDIVPPKTGDDTPIFLWVSLALLSGCLLFALKKIGANRTITMLLIFVLTASLLPVELAHADTAQTSPQQLSVKKNVAIKGVTTEVRSHVTYGAQAWAPDDEDALFYKEPDAEHIQYDEARKIYYVDNQILLVAKEGTPQAQVKALVESYGGTIVGMIAITDDYQAEFKQAMTYKELEELCEKLLVNSFIEHADIHLLFEIIYDSNRFIPNDEKWATEWATNTAYGDGSNWGVEAIQAPEAWDYKYLMGPVNVGIIDSMFDTSHEDFYRQSEYKQFEKVWNNPNDIFQYKGKNHPSENEKKEGIYIENSSYYHGTHVAGIIGAKFNNKKGIAGVAPTALLFGYSNHGSDTDYFSQKHLSGLMEIKYALSLLATANCRVINRSQGGGNSESDNQLLDAFISKLVRKGYDFLIVNSAGNAGKDLANSDEWFIGKGFTENEDRILVVGSLRNKKPNFEAGDKYGFYYDCERKVEGYQMAPQVVITANSNYGSRVDLIAPGVSILSTYPGNEYKKLQGTSMAAPHASGVAAMCYAINPNLTAPEVKEILCRTAKEYKMVPYPPADENGNIVGKEYGVLNAKLAVEAAIKSKANTIDDSSAGIIYGACYQMNTNTKEDATGVNVVVYEKNKNGELQVKTDAWLEDGKLELLIEPGSYEIVFYKKDYIPWCVNVTINAKEVKVLEDITLYSASTLPEGGIKIQGTIVDAVTKEPIPNVDIVFRLDPRFDCGSCTTDDEGKYTAYLSIEGDLYATLTKDGYMDGKMTVISSRLYHDDQNGSMTKLPITLGGLVKSTDGTPLDNVAVTVTGAYIAGFSPDAVSNNNADTKTVYTDKNGYWSLANCLAEYDYYASFKLDGYTFSNPVPIPHGKNVTVIGTPIISGKLTKKEYTITPTQTNEVMLEGEVKAAKGAFIESIYIHFIDTNGNVLKNERRDYKEKNTDYANLANIFAVNSSVFSDLIQYYINSYFTIAVYVKAYDIKDAVLIGTVKVNVKDTAVPTLTAPTVYANNKALTTSKTQDYDLANGNLTLSWSGDQGGNGSYKVKIGMISTAPLFDGSDAANNQVDNNSILTVNGTRFDGSATKNTSVTIPTSTLQAGKYLKIAVASTNDKGEEKWTVTGLTLVSTQQPEPVIESDFTFNTLTDTTCEVTGYTGKNTEIVIPSTDTEGRTVVGIAEKVLENKRNLKSVTIPGEVTSIGDDAFYVSDSLTIYGYFGSEANRYANHNGIFFVPLDGAEIVLTKTEYECYAGWGVESIEGYIDAGNGFIGYAVSTIVRDDEHTYMTNGQYIDEDCHRIDLSVFNLRAGRFTDPGAYNLVVQVIVYNYSGCFYYVELPLTVTVKAGTVTGSLTKKSYTVAQDGSVALKGSVKATSGFIGRISVSVYGGDNRALTVEYSASDRMQDVDLSDIFVIEPSANKNFAAVGEYDIVVWAKALGSEEAVKIGEATVKVTEATIPTNIIASGECGAEGDNITWTLNNQGTLEITGNGDMAIFKSSDTNPFSRDDIKDVVFKGNITSIHVSNFWNCTSLTELNLPASVVQIGLSIDGGGWYYSDISRYISSIHVSEDNPSFSSHNGVLFNKDKTCLLFYPSKKTDAEYIIPKSVTSIYPGAFESSSLLKSIVIPDGVRNIEHMTFYDCEGLTAVSLPKELRSIGLNAFSFCTSLTTISIPSEVNYISSRAFADCRNLTSVTVPNSVTSIGDTAFSGCDNLTIYGIQGSTAEKYANEHSIPFVALEGPQAETVLESISITHPFIGNVIDASPVMMFNNDATQTWTINANFDWTLSVSGDTWFTVDKRSGSAGTTFLTIKIKGYTTNHRYGTLTFKKEGEVKAKIEIEQGEVAVYEDSFSVSHPAFGNILEQEKIYMHNGASYQTWTVMSNVDWEIETVDDDWFTVDPVSGSANTAENQSTSVVISIDDGVAAGESREGKIRFVYHIDGKRKRTSVKIVQYGGQ